VRLNPKNARRGCLLAGLSPTFGISKTREPELARVEFARRRRIVGGRRIPSVDAAEMWLVEEVWHVDPGS